MIITSMLAPLVNIIGLGVFARHGNVTALPWILTGNIVLALMFANQNNVASNFTAMRVSGALEYFAMLPIRRNLLIAATVSAFFLLSLPALLVTTVLGSVILRVPLNPDPLILAVIPLCVLPMAGVGALIGTLVHSPEQSSSISLSLTVLMTVTGAVVIPARNLPRPLYYLGFANPATYAASAIRQALLGPLTARLALDATALVLFTLLVFVLVVRKVRWQKL
jgi:ABC-2 type transport system permease protein